MEAKFIKVFNMIYIVKLMGKEITDTQVKITVKPLIRIAKVMMKKGRT